MSVAELLHAVEQTTANLAESGLGVESVIGISISDEVDHLIATLATMALGAGQVTLASFDGVEVRTQLARRALVTHVISDDEGFFLDGTQSVEWSSVDSTHGRAPRSTSAVRPGRLLLKTSGTTGHVNLVELSETQISAQSARHRDYSGEHLLRLASIEHNNSKRHRLYCVWNGGTNVFISGQDRHLADFCREYGVTCLDISRMHAVSIVKSYDSTSFGHLKIRTGGSSIPIALRRAIESDVTRNLFVRYAATECGAIAMAGPGDHDDDECVGRPLPGVELEIVGPDGTVVRGESGMIRLRSPGMATHYFDNPAASREKFIDGWFHPGDIGMLRSDGQLIVHGRQDDMMIMNGLNIYPTDIERVLERHSAVQCAAAVPLDSPTHGQIPVAAVELDDGSDVSEAELQRYARSELALRAPRRVLIMQTLPRNGQGKIMRNQIAALFGNRRVDT